jgi:hypothetical protein
MSIKYLIGQTPSMIAMEAIHKLASLFKFHKVFGTVAGLHDFMNMKDGSKAVKDPYYVAWKRKYDLDKAMFTSNVIQLFKEPVFDKTLLLFEGFSFKMASGKMGGHCGYDNKIPENLFGIVSSTDGFFI